LRAYQLKQWKRGRTIFQKLRAMGASVDVAARVAGNGRRWWHSSALYLNMVLNIRFFDQMGLPRLAG
jgi:RNA-directed DNA polymerase